MIKTAKFAIIMLVSMVVVTGVSLVSANNAKDINNQIDVRDITGNADIKIRYIDVFGAMRECKEGVKESEKIESKRKELAKSVEAESKKFQAAVTKFNSEASTLNDTARAKKEQELAKMKRDGESFVQSCEEEMKIFMQQTTEQLAKEVEKAVSEIAQKENLDAVVDKMTGRVVYTSPKADYTSKIIQAMNKNFDTTATKAGKATTVAATKTSSKSA